MSWSSWVVVGHITDPTDMLGNTRFIDGNFDGKVAWDIGAYEFNSFPPPRFSSPPRLTSDGWKLNITGAPNKWVHVQRSSNLKDWEEIWYDLDGVCGREAGHRRGHRPASDVLSGGCAVATTAPPKKQKCKPRLR